MNSESIPQAQLVCLPDDTGHCVTCSDEALPAKVLKIDLEQFTALVEIKGSRTEVDISLVEPVECGEMLLVHGGVALGRFSEESGHGLGLEVTLNE
jgi:hydrogenase assembly chaperone HypC/HupF